MYQSFQPFLLVPVTAFDAAENEPCLPSIPEMTMAPWTTVAAYSVPA
jgi:hypothetical protein